MPSHHLNLCCPLLLSSIFPKFSVFSKESVLGIRWPNNGVSASALVLPVNTQAWFPLGLTGCISLQSKGHSGVFSSTTIRKHGLFRTQPFFVVQLLQPCMTTGKTIAFTRQTFIGKVMSLLFNILPRLVITFLPRSKHLLISWLQSPSAMILEPRKIKSASVSTVSPSICHEVMGPDAMM